MRAIVAFRWVLVIAFVVGLGLVASSPAMAYCRDCNRTVGCYDVNPGASGYNFCNDTNGYCRLQGWGCTGFSCNEVPGSCTDEQSAAPEATIVLRAGGLGAEPFAWAALARLAEVPGICVAGTQGVLQ